MQGKQACVKKHRSASSVLHSCNVKTQICVTHPQCVNRKIAILNRKLKKLVKAFPSACLVETSNCKDLFTYHGLHCNKTGKRYVTHQLAYTLQSIFKHKISALISLSWYKLIQGTNNLNCEADQMKPLNRNSRSRKQRLKRPWGSVALTMWHPSIRKKKKLALTSPTGGGRSVGIVRSRTKATELS